VSVALELEVDVHVWRLRDVPFLGFQSSHSLHELVFHLQDREMFSLLIKQSKQGSAKITIART